MRKTFLLIHRWLALPLGLFITIMCFTGAILLFKGDIAAMLGCEANDMAFFKTITRLHRWLFIAPENPHGGMSVGRFIMGLSAIAATLIVISGVVLWWPNNHKMLKSRLTVSLNKGWRRFVYDSHVSLGIYAAVFLLLMSLTGPVWSFRWYRSAAVTVIGAEDGKGQAIERGGKGASAPPFTHGQPDRSGRNHDRNAENTPEQKGRNHGGHEENAPKRSGGRNANGGKAPAQRTFISLHTGKWGGVVTKTLYFLAAVIGGFLPLSGYYMWWQKRKKR